MRPTKEDRGEYRAIHVALVDSPEFQALSAAARTCLLILKLKLGRSGINVFYPETLPRLTGTPFEGASDAVRELIAQDWLRVEGHVFWIRNGLRFEPDNPLASENSRKGIVAHLKSLPKLEIVNEFADYYDLERPFEVEAPSKPPRDPFEARKREEGRGKREDGNISAAAGEPVLDREAYATAAFVTLNQSTRKIFGDDVELVPSSHGSRQNAIDWHDAGVPFAIVRQVITDRVRSSPSMIRSLRYFDKAVMEAHARSANDRNGKSAAAAPRGNPPARAAGKASRRRRAHGD